MVEPTILEVETTLDLPVERVLMGVKDKEFDHVVVLGCYENGEIGIHCTSSDVGFMILLLERAKSRLIRNIES